MESGTGAGSVDDEEATGAGVFSREGDLEPSLDSDPELDDPEGLLIGLETGSRSWSSLEVDLDLDGSSMLSSVNNN